MHVFVVTWGQPGRTDWRAVLVRAGDPDEALVAAREAYPERLPPTVAGMPVAAVRDPHRCR